VTGYERDILLAQERQAEALKRISDVLERLAPLVEAAVARQRDREAT
jgi:hypothetical protein